MLTVRVEEKKINCKITKAVEGKGSNQKIMWKFKYTMALEKSAVILAQGFFPGCEKWTRVMEDALLGMLNSNKMLL